jgi:natural product biosynthesis luciferase-like monooxygenase protein
VTLVATAGPPVVLRLQFNPHLIDEMAARRWLGHLETVLDAMARDPERRVGDLPLLTAVERRQILHEWNDTRRAYATDQCVHVQVAAQAGRTPERVAIIVHGVRITYRDLEERANHLARHLVALGAGPGVVVGLCARRSIELVVGLLAILKSGAAYLPLDPEYPSDRLQFMLEDARVGIVVIDRASSTRLHSGQAERVFLDEPALWGTASVEVPASQSSHLAYVIYTSGSTGRPNGVMVTHRNVVSFFAAMDDVIGSREPGVWLAVTSLSFDISVLELLWTLSRGFTVVVHAGMARPSAHRAAPSPRRGIDFSLFYFASDEGAVADKYRLLLEGARFADAHGFAAVWTPERHFHAFGGLYPNPSVVSAALAVQTSRVQIRAGSVVLPLHHPARVVEEWAVVDNLSNGRVGLSFASGWQPDDFLLNPANYARAKAVMMRDIEVVRRLWRGEKVTFPGPSGDVTIGTLPRPLQEELPVWITSAGNPETFRLAGQAGTFVLTHLLGQTLEELKVKLQAYREAWREGGHQGNGHVTLMLHTFVGESDGEVRAAVREPMKRYLASSVSLIKSVASTFPAFKKVGACTADEIDRLFARLTPEDLDALAEHAFDRYYKAGGLFGTVDECVRRIQELEPLGVDEVACLLDFGVDADKVLASLEYLDRVRARASQVREEPAADDSIADEIERYGVTHLQCTPSFASMMVADTAVRPALRRLRRLLVGGEALSPILAADLGDAVGGHVTNMYGPTETTVWSATWTLDGSGDTVPIGRPIANTQLYVLDRQRAPVPVGVAGELFIAGDGVARGYLSRPELTAERFVSNPFAGNGARMYRTGDLVRYRADGTIAFLGRIDHQIKIRGHRIELGEIESVLRELPGVSDAVVVAREDSPGDVRLVAYVVSAPGSPQDIERLKDILRERLPAIMVPSAISTLPALPLTPNGKVDRRALPVPSDVVRAMPHAPLVAEGPLEEQVAAIWCAILNVSSVSVEDNFFDLGGHSLLAIQVLSRLRERLDRNIPMTDLFRFPTVRSLARHLAGSLKGSAALDRAQAKAARRLETRRVRAIGR